MSRTNTFVLLAIVSLLGNARAQSPAGTVQQRLGYPASARLLILHADDYAWTTRSIAPPRKRSSVTGSPPPASWYPAHGSSKRPTSPRPIRRPTSASTRP